MSAGERLRAIADGEAPPDAAGLPDGTEELLAEAFRDLTEQIDIPAVLARAIMHIASDAALDAEAALDAMTEEAAEAHGLKHSDIKVWWTLFALSKQRYCAEVPCRDNIEPVYGPTRVAAVQALRDKAEPKRVEDMLMWDMWSENAVHLGIQFDPDASHQQNLQSMTRALRERDGVSS